MRIHLIRHGKTLANKKHLYCGKTDLLLTEEGRAETQNLKKQNIYEKCDIFIASPLKRAVQTLEIIYDNPHFLINEYMREMDFGIFEMRCYKDIFETLDYISWMDDLENYKIPNGESKKEFEKRVLYGFYDITERYKDFENICIVTHGGVISIIMDTIFQKKDHFLMWQPKNGEGYIVDMDKNKYEKISVKNNKIQ